MSHRRAAIIVVLGLCAPCAGIGGAGTAQADEPRRTGWWNAASAGGVAAPSTTSADDLHVGNGGTGPLAVAAVSYIGQPYTSATLTLHIVSNTAAGTPAVIACPTKDDTWKAGGDQPLSDAPAYTCQGQSITGIVGKDTGGATLTFLLDASTQLTLGTTTLALVPVTGSTTPFSLDIAKPGATSLVVDGAQARPPGRRPSTQPPTPTTASPIPAAPGSSSPSGPAPAGLSAGSGLSGAVSLSQPPDGVAPALAPPLPSAAGPSLAPQVAGAGAQVGASTPVALHAADRAAGLSTDRERGIALVLLVALVGGLGYLLGNKQTPPLRLLGGRARAAGIVDDGGAVRPGGIGRFSKPRTAAARRLL